MRWYRWGWGRGGTGEDDEKVVQVRMGKRWYRWGWGRGGTGEDDNEVVQVRMGKRWCWRGNGRVSWDLPFYQHKQTAIRYIPLFLTFMASRREGEGERAVGREKVRQRHSKTVKTEREIDRQTETDWQTEPDRQTYRQSLVSCYINIQPISVVSSQQEEEETGNTCNVTVIL